MKIKGISRNHLPIDQPPEKARFMRNAVISNKKDAVQNELGFSKIRDYNLTDGIVGEHLILDKFILFEKREDRDAISEIDSNGNRIELFNDLLLGSKFNFSYDHPVTAQHYIDPFGARVIAWIDGLNPPRIINLDNPDVDDLNDTLLFPLASQFTINYLKAIDHGGTLSSGARYMFVRYEERDSTYTDWFSLGLPLFTTDEANVLPYEFDGAPAGSPTTYSIETSLSYLDDRFDFVRLGVIEKIGGILRAYQFDRVSLTEPTVLVYSGNETKEEISLDTMLEGTAYYRNAQAISQLNNRLYLANVEVEEELDMQHYANQITVHYVESRAVEITDNKDNQINATPGFKHGEVYALYIQYQLLNGKFTRAFHIPGRISNAADRELISRSGIDGFIEKFRFESTFEDSVFGAGTAGADMGYWENANEVYPDTFPDFAGEKIRHHRMPPLEWAWQNNSGLTVGRACIAEMPACDIRVSNVQIPTEYEGKIQGWRILYAQKDSKNATVLGYDIPYPTRTLNSDINNIRNPTGPWGVEFALKEGNSYLLNGTGHNTLIGHNPDFLYSKAALSNITFIRAHGIYEIDIADFNQPYQLSYGTIHSKTGNISGSDECLNGLFVISNTSSALEFNAANYDVTYGDEWKEAVIQTAEYVAQGIKLGDFNNTLSEELIFMNTYTDLWSTLNLSSPLLYMAIGARDIGETSLHSGNMKIPLCSYEQLLNDVHVSMFSQTLALTDGVHTRDSDIIRGGDAKVSRVSWQSSMPRFASSNAVDEISSNGSVRTLWTHLTESTFNWDMRHQEDGNPGGNYFPHTRPCEILENSNKVDSRFYNELEDTIINQILYNNDYTSINNVWPVVIYNPDVELAAQLQNTITRSITNNPSSPLISWKTFIPSDAYVMPRHRGPIWNLQGLENERLLVHCEDTLFITRDRSKLSGTQTDVNLAAGDIFDLQPAEVATTEKGYAGITHRTFAKLTKIGYVFIDDKQKKVFVYSGKLDELDRDNMSLFIRDNFEKLEGKPFSKSDPQGYTIEYDEFFDRLLIGKIHSQRPLMLSHSTLYKSYASMHDWHPNWLFATRDNQLLSYALGVFGSSVGSSIFKHNVGLPGRYYNSFLLNNSSIDPFEIDIVFNNEKKAVKVFQIIEWNSEVLNSSGLELYDKTFDNIGVYSSNKVSAGMIPVTIKQGMIGTYNTVRAETIWRFNGFRNFSNGSAAILDDVYHNYALNSAAINLNTPWFRAGRFIDKYIVVRFSHANISGYSFSLLDAEAISRQSFR